MEPPGERTRGAGHRSAAPASRAPQLGGSPPCQSHARCRDHGGAVVCGLPALDDRGAEMVDGTGTPLSVTRCCVRQAEDTTLLQRPQQLWGTSPCHAGRSALYDAAPAGIQMFHAAKHMHSFSTGGDFYKLN
jgi:hypothetical protein